MICAYDTTACTPLYAKAGGMFYTGLNKENKERTKVKAIEKCQESSYQSTAHPLFSRNSSQAAFKA